MGQINDELYKDLVESGYEGHINDMLYKWLGDNSYAGSTLPERMFSYGGLAKIIRDVLAGEFGFNPLQLFSQGEQGVWYDPSDLSTLFQDAAGTTPVTTDGDPVGRMEDKSGNGNHATQSVAASRPVYQRGDSRGVVNLFKWSEDATNAAWSFTGGVKTGGEMSSRGDNKAVLLEGPSAVPPTRSVTTPHSGACTVRVALKYNTKVSGQLLLRNNTTATNYTTGNVNFQTGQITGTGWASEPLDNGFYLYSFTQVTGISAGDNLSLYCGTLGAAPSDFDVIVDYAQLEQGTTATAYQRNDSHLGGVATGSADDLHWLAGDGVDDYLVSTTGGVLGAHTIVSATAVTDSVTASIVSFGEQSTGKRRSHFLWNGGSGPYRYYYSGFGAASNLSTGAGIGAGAVLTTTVDDNKFLSTWVNGANSGTKTISIVNFSGDDVVVMASPNLVEPFKGNIYGVVILDRVIDGERAKIEQYLAQKSGVTLP